MGGGFGVDRLKKQSPATIMQIKDFFFWKMGGVTPSMSHTSALKWTKINVVINELHKHRVNSCCFLAQSMVYLLYQRENNTD